MYCPDCGGEIPDGVMFCRHCGRAFAQWTQPQVIQESYILPQGFTQPVVTQRAQPPQVCYPATVKTVPGVTSGSITVGVLTIATGMLLILSAFIYWIPVTGFSHGFSMFNGWELMMRNPGSGNFTWCSEIGFSGFWPLFIGVLVILFGSLAIAHRWVGIGTTMLGSLGIGAAAVTMLLVYEKTQPELPGPGLWLFGACSIFAFILGVIRMNYKSLRTLS